MTIPGGSPSAAPSPLAPDALLENQWYLKSQAEEPAGINARNAWPMSVGAGAVIGVMDDGLQWAHPDLSPNYLASASWDFVSNDSDPQPFPWEPHGTAVVGIAAGRGDNSIGVAGVAPQASWAGLRLTMAGSDAQKASAFNYLPNAIDILTAGWNPNGNGLTLEAPGPLATAARQSAITNGRQGKGRVFVWPSGDGRLNSDDCNFDGYANSRYVIAVGSVSDAANLAPFSEGCAALFVVGPSDGGSRGITTTDLMGTAGYNTSDYTTKFPTATTASASSAVAGTVALMLARNPSLTWRDVQHILRLTSVNGWPTYSGWTSGPYKHHENFGFGLVDAAAAVAMAGTWTNVPAEGVLAPSTRVVNVPVPEGGSAGISDTITIPASEANFVIEHIEVDFTATHPRRGELEVKLISPTGEISRLARYRPYDTGDNFNNWRFSTVRHWGETAAGEWQLNVSDVLLQDSGVWNNWTLRIYGYRTTLPPPGGFNKTSPADGATGQPNSPTLNWQASSAATDYEYCIDTTDNNNCNAGWVSTGGATSVVLGGLTSGTSFYWQVRARNAAGITYADGGAASYWGFTTAAVTVPGAPTGVSGTPGNAQVSVSFTPPASNGGSPITSYTAVASPGGATATGSGSPLVVTGLTNGTAYTFTVRATNSVGTGPASSPSAAVTPATVPGAPTGVSGTPGNAQVSVSFTPPASNGGATITGYTVTASPGGATATGAGSPLVVTGLTNGTAYTFTVKATNSVGTGASSSPSAAVTPSTVPGAPTVVSATPGNAQVSVSFTPPASNGGLPITSYTATASPGGATATGAGSPLVVTGLTNGTTYTFTVTATNGTGTGPASNASAAVTPATVPGAPTGVSGTPGNAQVSVSFTPPASNGGATITGYTVTASPGGAMATGAGSPLVVTGLTNGTAYTFTVKATNSVGTGASSSPSSPVTPATLPGAPTVVSVTPGNAQVTVNFTAPADDGGFPITSYTATASPGGATATGAGSPLVVTGLTNGTSYTFTVKAATTVGTGPASNVSNAVTPATVPGAPTGVSGAAGNGQVTVSFSPPASNGGAPITGYTVTASPGGATATGGGSPLVVSGLTNGTAYTFTVNATNSVGTGASSSPSSPVTPAAVPGAPTAVSGTPGNGQVTVSFTPPVDSGGTPITSYTATASPGGATATGAGSPLVVTGLTNGTAYTFTVKATNSVGAGPASTPSSAVTPATVPGAPTAASGTPGNGQVTVSFTPPASNGGASITGYTVTASPGGATATGGGSPLVVSGLTNGTAYTFTVTATNSVGTGASSSPSSPVTPATVPGAPTGVSGTPGNGQVTVNFTAPASNGGSAITGYTVTASPGGATGGGLGSPIVVSGLTNGIAYTFTVTATNNVGSGAPSTPSAPVTPATVPGAPTAVSGTPGDGQVTVSFTPPASNGGATITGYTATASPGGATATGSGSPLVVSGLTNGTAYTFTVTATNGVGVGPASSPSAPVTPMDPATFSKASPADGATGLSTGPTLQWTALTGASSYEYCIDTSDNGICNGPWVAAGAATSVTLSSLSDSTQYTWQVRALKNGQTMYADGVSTDFWTFTTAAPPGPFSRNSPAGGAIGEVVSPTLNWSVSAGATGYEYCLDMIDDGACNTSWMLLGLVNSVTLSGLLPGTQYFWHVRSINDGGTTYADGTPAIFWTFTTIAAPGVFGKTSPNNASMGKPLNPTLTWSASASASAYEYCYDTSNNGSCDSAWVSVGGNTSANLSGLAAGTTYYWQVRATNGAGTTYAQGSASATWRFTTIDLLPFAVGQGTFSPNGGWLQTFRGQAAGFAGANWLQVPWTAYNAVNGAVHPAFGDVDGDGRDELVIGLGTGGGGWIAILDDAEQNYALMRWVQVPWSTYNAGNGEVFPAVADLDGDGRAEIVAGLGPGGKGWFEIIDDAAAGFAHLAWKQTTWATYNAGPGATYPAAADLDGDGKAEIVIGLGSGGAGWMEVFNDAGTGYAHQAWIVIDWAAYNTANGTTHPAAGDVDGDGKAEIVVGLGTGGLGWVEVFDDAAAGFAHSRWLQVGWSAYNASSGEVHPAVGNLDADPAAEIVLGLASFAGGGGWFEIRDDASQMHKSMGWRSLDWAAFKAAGGATWPAIGKLPPGAEAGQLPPENPVPAAPQAGAGGGDRPELR